MAVSYCRGAIGDRLASLVRRGRFASVRVVVEVGEKDDKGHSIANESPLHPVREWAASVEGVSGVANRHVELDLGMDTHNH